MYVALFECGDVLISQIKKLTANLDTSYFYQFCWLSHRHFLVHRTYFNKSYYYKLVDIYTTQNDTPKTVIIPIMDFIGLWKNRFQKRPKH